MCHSSALRSWLFPHLILLTAAGALAAGCTGSIEDGGAQQGSHAGTGGDATQTPGDPRQAAADATLAAATVLRRLSIREYNNVIAALTYDTSRPFSLGDDERTPFDNDYTTNAQKPSTALIDTAEITASRTATKLLEDGTRLGKLMSAVGCPEPKGPTDSACFRQFITRFGRRALRRPLTDSPDGGEIQKYMSLLSIAQEDNNFYSAVRAAVQMFLQLPELMYRAETDTSRPVKDQPGVFRLNGFEVATRMSFLLWGEGPDDALLDRAQGGGLDTAQGVRDAAAWMLEDAKGRAMVSMFHAMWLNYQGLESSASPGITQNMRSQTGALIRRVIFDERRAWPDLLRSNRTYINQKLATHYGLTIPAASPLKRSTSAFEWLPWDGDRMGLLSEASFLGLAQALTEEQMVVRRGQFIRERLFCQQSLPKPAAVDVPKTAPRTPCKHDVFTTATGQGNCKGCHNLLNPVGFGLDRYDGAGAPRTHDRVDEFIQQKFPSLKVGDVLPQCPVHAEGELDGKAFSGPKELAELMLASPALNDCLSQQVYRFAIGRASLDDRDRMFASLLAESTGSRPFLEVLGDLVSSDVFRSRRQGE